MNKFKQSLLAMGLSGALLTGGVLVAQQEGLVLGTYVDPVGIVTACFGKTGPEFELGQRFSEQECLAMLADDLEVFDRQLTNQVRVPITDSERAAYLSFMYNVGAQNFSDSTLRKKLLHGDRIGACNELSRWVYAKGKKLQGLVNRREAERQLCLKELKHVSNH
ncbi:lysozyme [Shewanella baltica]|uniref:lysozyme n=1 Tax=Shewanella TaxID=22 RepID=UPI00217E7F68|nr:lysozyme [Shewanella baltica]MCS6178956.1 lysozyme [Shewanella baltica]MCS6255120.1 lysozyme [Shewanella baltica]MDR9767689.1 lysozyme [Shewanella baltica]